MKRSRVGAALRSAALLLPLAALFGCPSHPVATEPPPPPEAEFVSPAWVSQPLSWQKLEMIELWLESDAAAHGAELVVEAELQLNEGRVQFTRRDLDSASVSKETLKVRAENAKTGFEHVLANSTATAGQRNRAQIGLRAANALLAAPGTQELAIVPRAQWNARAARTANLTALKGAWSRITVHHSDENSSDPQGGTLQDAADTVRAIQKFHMDDPEHQWGDVGYHFLIDASGRIFEGRELKWQGAHAGGSNNIQNIGICMLGDLSRRAPTKAALKSLEVLLKSLRDKYRIPASRVFPHNEFSTTVCPGSALTAWIKAYHG
jgi:hypothetical protein